MPPKESPSASPSDAVPSSDVQRQPQPPPAEGPNLVTRPVASSSSDSGEPAEEVFEQRLDNLKDRLRRRRGAIRVTNAGFETGRPELRLTDDMRPDPSNPYNRPSIDALSKIKSRAVSNNMATSEDIMKSMVSIEGLGVPTEHVQTVLIQVAIYCKDASSSTYLDPRGTFEWPGGAIVADSVVAIIKRDAVTLRRFCRLYAPITWNFMLVHDAPPADWSAMKFHYNERFAAFDCFDYVENTAAVQPLEGLIRRPTAREKVAHAAYQDIALRRNAQDERFANLGVEVTGGKSGPEVTRNHNNANNK